MKLVFILAFVVILASLAFALFFMMRDKGNSNRMVNSLTMRVALSVALFIFVLVAHYLGWIEPTGLR